MVTEYQKKIQNRTTFHYYTGLLVRKNGKKFTKIL